MGAGLKPLTTIQTPSESSHVATGFPIPATGRTIQRVRAREPDHDGAIERDGVRVGYEVFGEGEPTIVLLTSWAIVHARQWKMQVPYLARHFRVIAVEGRGNGRADRPGTAEAYADREYVDDAIAVMDATGTDRAVVVGLSMGARHALQLAAWYPERAAGVVAIGTALPWPVAPDFDDPKESYEGWGKANRHYWLDDYRGWVEFFMSQVFTEPHSIKHWEDGVSWGLETTRRRCCSPPTRSALLGPVTPRRSAVRCGVRSSSSMATRTGSCRTRPEWRWPGGPTGNW